MIHSDKRERWCGDLPGFVVDVIANEICSHPDDEGANESTFTRGMYGLRVLLIRTLTISSVNSLTIIPKNERSLWKYTRETLTVNI